MKNGIKYLVAGLVATGLTMSSSYAVITVNWATAQNAFISDSALNYLDGNLVEVGAFSVAPTPGSASLANFTVFGTTLSGSGALAGTFSASKTAADVGFNHTQIYLVAFNNATGVVVPGTTQEGIFAVAFGSNSAWRFPATADTINTTTIDLQDLFTTGTSGVAATGAQAFFGSLGLDGSGPSDVAHLALVPGVVPEPSTWMLVGTGLIGLLGLRRRHS